MTGVPLPENEMEFIMKCSLVFPNILDLKILINPLDRFKGSLQKIADFFNVNRIGTMHNGGSDALTTSQVYYRLKSYMTKEDFEINVKKSNNIIWGLNKGFEFLKKTDGSFETG